MSFTGSLSELYDAFVAKGITPKGKSIQDMINAVDDGVYNGFKTAKLGSGTSASAQSVTFDISDYKNKPHFCYSVITGGYCWSNENEGAGGTSGSFSSQSIAEDGGIVTFGPIYGYGNTTTSSGRGSSCGGNIYFDAYIAYLG